VTDAIDRAFKTEQYQREQALAACKAPIEKPQEFNGHRYCLVCDIEISTPRLIANPQAVRCVDCQHLHEHQQQHYHNRK